MNEVLIIIPTYNESENIVKITESIFSIHQDINILVVDDNSPDGTSGKVKEVISNLWLSITAVIVPCSMPLLKKLI